jgi:dipeptidyl aminopeptidase/acylaminoacyl peptidase
LREILLLVTTKPTPSLLLHRRSYVTYNTELGYPWKHQDVWEKLAYFYQVENIKTTALFMGGNLDVNVPVLGGEQMYQALRALNRTTELVVYPGEYHEFTIPSHMEDRLKRYLAWYNHYVNSDPAPPSLPPDTSKIEIKPVD